MFNLKVFLKLLKVAYSCRNVDHIEVTQNLINRLYEEVKLSKFEYNSLLEALNDTQAGISKRYSCS